jgi:hypothetical protein
MIATTPAFIGPARAQKNTNQQPFPSISLSPRFSRVLRASFRGRPKISPKR